MPDMLEIYGLINQHIMRYWKESCAANAEGVPYSILNSKKFNISYKINFKNHGYLFFIHKKNKEYYMYLNFKQNLSNIYEYIIIGKYSACFFCLPKKPTFMFWVFSAFLCSRLIKTLPNYCRQVGAFCLYSNCQLERLLQNEC